MHHCCIGGNVIVVICYRNSCSCCCVCVVVRELVFSFSDCLSGFLPKSTLVGTDALNLALDIVWHSRDKKFVIFSDSLSCLLAIQNLQAESGYVMKFLRNYTALVNTGKTVLLCRFPGHVGIKGNEQADEVAKMALHSSISAVKYPPSDLYHDVTSLCYKLWQADWDQHTGNKLHSVKPHLGYDPLSSLSRRDAVVLQRLRIGHTRLSHSYLLSLSLSLSLSRSASLLFMWLCPYCYSFTP